MLLQFIKLVSINVLFLYGEIRGLERFIHTISNEEALKLRVGALNTLIESCAENEDVVRY